MLNVSNLNVYYGDSHVLRDLSLDLAPGESLAIMGRNGMGKTTLLRSLVGMLPTRSGSIKLAGQELTGSKSYERVAAGVGFVPQGRMIFPYLSVEENILTGMKGAPAAPIPDYIFEYFPVLFEMRRRKGGNLSGASSNSWPSRGHWFPTPRCWCSTSPQKAFSHRSSRTSPRPSTC